MPTWVCHKLDLDLKHHSTCLHRCTRKVLQMFTFETHLGKSCSLIPNLQLSTLTHFGTGPDELQGYLEALMAKLLEVVRTGNSETQETALGAIASAANAAGASFRPYVSAVFPVLRQYMEVGPPNLVTLDEL